ncbi:MAG TPA: ATP-binding protein [Actinomycetota bacterium]|nr:ATP-binding protein [Actinomycetota bacterium]
MPTTVLLCDAPDEVSLLQYHLLREAPDLIVEVTTDAVRAVEAVARARPDVVVCEPDLDGLAAGELIRRLRATSPTAKIVARSAFADADRVAAALGAGASAFLTKAEPHESVVAAIRSVGGGAVVLSPVAAMVLGDELAAMTGRIRELETELSELRDDVSAGSTAKADFLANISHELRTPVTVAKGIAYVLRNPTVPEVERAQFLDQLQASLDKLMAIVDEVITMSELEKGTFTLELAPTDLAPLVRHAVDEVSRQYPAQSIVAQVPDTLSAVADGAKIGGVVRELLDNACRYSPPEAPVEVVARILHEGVVVTVTDHGEGIDRSVATKAFEQPFSTGEGILRKEKAGVGVGLHLARQIVVEHGGIMWADPLPGGGTRVSFCLPAQAGDRLSVPPSITI